MNRRTGDGQPLRHSLTGTDARPAPADAVTADTRVAGVRRAGPELRALTICQPYAELIRQGEKLVENRTWATAYRGPLAIHAGKSRAWLDEDDPVRHPGMTFGAIVAVADLYGCVQVGRLPEELRGHEHAHGPWCWLLRNVRPVDPIPCRGGLGLWTPIEHDARKLWAVR